MSHSHSFLFRGAQVCANSNFSISLFVLTSIQVFVPWGWKIRILSFRLTDRLCVGSASSHCFISFHFISHSPHKDVDKRRGMRFAFSASYLNEDAVTICIILPCLLKQWDFYWGKLKILKFTYFIILQVSLCKQRLIKIINHQNKAILVSLQP